MKQTILVIDDDLGIRTMATDVIELLGYRVVTACNGREGVETACRIHPDLVLCDCFMPEMSGIETLKALRGTPETKNLRFSFVSGNITPSLLRQAEELGISGFLPKPFSFSELRKLISSSIADLESRKDVPLV